MKEVILNKSLDFVTQYKNYTEEDKEKLKYGLEGIYLTITKMVVIIGLSILLHMFKEVIILLLLFNILRYFGFGVHAGKSSECLISSILLFIVVPYILLKITFTNTLVLIISSICIPLLFVFSPADTKRRPFPKTKKKLFRKIMTTLLSIIYSGSCLFITDNTLIVLLISSVIAETVMVNPLTYILLKQPYNNYKKVV